MRKITILPVVGALMIASATCFFALAGPPGPPPGPPPHGGGLHGGPPGPPPGPPPHGGDFPGLWAAPPDLIDKLELTDDQRKEMRLAYVDLRNKTRKVRNALVGLRDEKKTMLISGKIDQAKLAKLDEETTKLASELMGEELKMKRESLSMLTPDQRERLADFLGKLEIRHGPNMMRR